MMSTKRMVFVTRFASVCLCAFLILGATALAQGPNAIPAEKRAQLWEMESNCAAGQLGLSADLSAKLSAAYKAARESQGTASEALRGQGGGNFEKIIEISKAEKAKFETAIKGFLNPEQTAKALSVLGTFNRRWDAMTNALDSMGLAEKPKADAMKLTADFVVASGEAMQSVAAGSDMETARTKVDGLWTKLDEDMAKILSPEQSIKWKEMTARRGGPGQGGGGQREGRGGRGEGGGAAGAQTPAAK